jgi:hypothetical protein
MTGDRCRRQKAIASEWEVHASFEHGQLLSPRCYLRVGSWPEAELTRQEAEGLWAGINP